MDDARSAICNHAAEPGSCTPMDLRRRRILDESSGQPKNCNYGGGASVECAWIAGLGAEVTARLALRFSHRLSGDHAVLEMDEDECGLGDVAYLAGTHRDVLEGSPAFAKKREASFAEAAQRTEQGVSGAGIDVRARSRLWAASPGCGRRDLRLRSRDRPGTACPSDKGARWGGPVRGRQ